MFIYLKPVKLGVRRRHNHQILTLNSLTMHNEEKKVERNITNESDDEIILVLLNSNKAGPIFVQGGAVKNIRLGQSLWSDSLELYRCSIGTPTSLRSFGEKFQESQR